MMLYSIDGKGRGINVRLTKEEYAGIMSEKFRSTISCDVVNNFVCKPVKKKIRGVRRKNEGAV